MNNILILIVLAVILFFTVDYIHNKYIKNKITEKFNNFNNSKDSYETFENTIDTDNTDTNTIDTDNTNTNTIDTDNTDTNTIDTDNTNTNTIDTDNTDNDDNISIVSVKNNNSSPKELYYKQYLYKKLSANNNDQIIKLNLTDSENEINIDFIFNNVLDHQKINEIPTDNNTAIIKDNNIINTDTIYNIEKKDCLYKDSDNYDNNNYKWVISQINSDLKAFTIKFTNLNDNNNSYLLLFTLKKSLLELYNNNINFQQLCSTTILDNIKLTLNGNKSIVISNIFVNSINFSEFTVNRIQKFHKNIENTIETKILSNSYENIREYNKIQANIDKLENYYKFKKNIAKTYSKYKTLN
jgi:hypothetical protein